MQPSVIDQFGLAPVLLQVALHANDGVCSNSCDLSTEIDLLS